MVPSSRCVRLCRNNLKLSKWQSLVSSPVVVIVFFWSSLTILSTAFWMFSLHSFQAFGICNHWKKNDISEILRLTFSIINIFYKLTFIGSCEIFVWTGNRGQLAHWYKCRGIYTVCKVCKVNTCSTVSEQWYSFQR